MLPDERLEPTAFGKTVFEYSFELLTDGRLRAIEQVRGSGRDQDNVWEFERQ
jgi:hypothetical protein